MQNTLQAPPASSALREVLRSTHPILQPVRDCQYSDCGKGIQSISAFGNKVREMCRCVVNCVSGSMPQTLTLQDGKYTYLDSDAIGCATRATGELAKIMVVINRRCRPAQDPRAVWCRVYLCQTLPGIKAGRTALLRCVKDCSIAVYRTRVSSQSRNATGLFAPDPV